MRRPLREQAPWDNDPIYEYVFMNKMQPYVNWAVKWWPTWQEHEFYDTGNYPAQGAPPGMTIRFSRTLAHSPVEGVQAFPYVPVPFLQMHHIPGGVRKLVDDVCHSGVVVDGMRLIEKKYLHGTDRNGQFIAIVPVDMVVESSEGVRGRYVWMNGADIITIASGMVDAPLQRRFMAYCRKK